MVPQREQRSPPVGTGKQSAVSSPCSQLIIRACSVVQLCLTFCYPMDCSPPGSSVHEIFQARILEWVARHCLSTNHCAILSTQHSYYSHLTERKTEAQRKNKVRVAWLVCTMQPGFKARPTDTKTSTLNHCPLANN